MKYLVQTKSHLVFGLVILLAMFFGLQTTFVKAQDAGFEAGLAGQAATRLGMDITSNVIGMNMIEAATRNRGLARIKSRRATTTFTHSPDIYSYVASTLIFEAYEPQTKLEQAKLIQQQLGRFEARMIKAGYKLHDNADAANFAFILSYQAQYDKPQLTSAELEKFGQYRQLARRYLLNDAFFQGSSEQAKERMYVIDAIMSEQAIEWREKARMARTDAERRETDKQAKQHADEKMKIFNDEELHELLQAGKQLK